MQNLEARELCKTSNCD